MANPHASGFPASGARTPPLLIILGSDADPRAQPQGGYRVGGNSDIYKLLPDGFAFDQLNLSKQFLNARDRPDPARYRCVLNLVTDPDQHPQVLERLRNLLRGHGERVINPPEAVLKTTRDQVAKRLAGKTGLRVPKVIRQHNPKPGAAAAAAERAGLAFPLIVRRAGTHTGRIVGVVEGPDQLNAACVGPGQFILIEYVDFASPDGLYRKYRIWSFGGMAIFRHMIVSDHWNVHVKQREGFMANRPALIEEEKRLLETPDGAFPDFVHQVFAAVQERIGLDFFGMDFGLDRQGQVVLFEANATMSFFPLERPPQFNYLAKIRQPAQAAFWRMLFPEN
jgi:hypothetical protein